MPHKPLPPGDLAHILRHARPSLLALRHATLFITGGTGFFGHWLLESLLHADRELALNVRATVLTRNASPFRSNSPHITANPAITLLEGDIATFPFPTGPHTHIIHAATDSGGKQAGQTPEALAASVVAGTRRVLHFAHATGATRLLYTSTGAVYGRSTPLLHTPETYPIPTLPPYSYQSAKLAAENLCLQMCPLDRRRAFTPQWRDPRISLEPSQQPVLEPVIARCFAFVGPHLPLDAHFAIGNFLNSAIKNKPIHITGDGTPRRSWLYMSDLAIWLWTLLTHGQPRRAYNVGSDDGMTIAQAAHLTSTTLSSFPLSFRSGAKEPACPVPVQIDGTPTGAPAELARWGGPDPATPLNSYVPDITRARTELGLEVTIPLPEALRRTAAWYQS